MNITIDQLLQLLLGVEYIHIECDGVVDFYKSSLADHRQLILDSYGDKTISEISILNDDFFASLHIKLKD